MGYASIIAVGRRDVGAARGGSFSLNRLLAEVRDSVLPRAGASGTRLQLKLPGCDCLFQGDRGMLLEALAALAADALEAAAEASRVRLRLSIAERSYEILVEDNGAGDIGAGLATAVSAAMAHGGELRVSRALPMGRRVRLSLPRERSLFLQEPGANPHPLMFSHAVKERLHA